MQTVTLNPVLVRINDLIQPKSPLPEALLLKIQGLRDGVVNNMKVAVVMAGIDSNRIRQLTVTSEPAPTDERTLRFVQKMFQVINDGIDTINPLREFLNSTLPSLLNMDEMKARMNANPSRFAEIVAEFTGPSNKSRQEFVNAQGIKLVNDFMLSLDPASVVQMIGNAD